MEQEQRGSERIPAEIEGSGVLEETGEAFSFRALDLSLTGMQVKLDGISPTAGQAVSLNIGLNNGAPDGKIVLTGEIVRMLGAPPNHYGLKWAKEQTPDHVKFLERFYSERFFDMME